MGMFLRRGPAPHRTRASDLEIGQTIKLNLNGTPWESQTWDIEEE